VVSQDKPDPTVENDTDPDDSWTEQLEEAAESQAHNQADKHPEHDHGSGEDGNGDADEPAP
jgi:hypothetical protein